MVKYRLLVEELIEQKDTKDKVYPLMGLLNDCAFDAVIWKLLRSKQDEIWLREFQAFLVMYISKIFRPRDTCVFLLQVLSEADFERLKANARRSGAGSDGWRVLGWGLFLIITRDGFRWEKYESKTRHGRSAKGADLVLRTKGDFDSCPLLKTVSEWTVQAFEMTTGYRATAESTQPQGYIAYDVNDEDGFHPYLQLHAFRFHSPANTFGSKHFICIDVPHSGERTLVRADLSTVLSGALKAKTWKNYEEAIEDREVIVKQGKDEFTSRLQVLPNAPQPRKEFKTRFYEKNLTVGTHIRKAEQVFNATWKAECKPSSFTGPFSGRILNEEFYRSLTRLKELNCGFTESGRHGSAEVHLQVMQAFSSCGDSNIKRELDVEMEQIMVKEAYETKKVVVNNYMVIKDPAVRVKVELKELNVNRLSSHPNWTPTMDTFPWTVVDSAGGSSEFWHRCHDMRELSANEQNLQMRWFQYVGAFCRKIKQFEAAGHDSMNFKSFKRRQELAFEQARALHRQKFPQPSTLERVKRYLLASDGRASKRARVEPN